MRPLGFKTRLWLAHVAALAVMLAVAAPPYDLVVSTAAGGDRDG
jgi:hypothetical protein